MFAYDKIFTSRRQTRMRNTIQRTILLALALVILNIGIAAQERAKTKVGTRGGGVGTASGAGVGSSNGSGTGIIGRSPIIVSGRNGIGAARGNGVGSGNSTGIAVTQVRGLENPVVSGFDPAAISSPFLLDMKFRCYYFTASGAKRYVAQSLCY
jgi:hypothetical protein